MHKIFIGGIYTKKRKAVVAVCYPEGVESLNAAEIVVSTSGVFFQMIEDCLRQIIEEHDPQDDVHIYALKDDLGDLKAALKYLDSSKYKARSAEVCGKSYIKNCKRCEELAKFKIV